MIDKLRPFSHQALLEVADSGPGAPELPGEGSWGGQPAAEAGKQALKRAILGQSEDAFYYVSERFFLEDLRQSLAEANKTLKANKALCPHRRQPLQKRRCALLRSVRVPLPLWTFPPCDLAVAL